MRGRRTVAAEDTSGLGWLRNYACGAEEPSYLYVHVHHWSGGMFVHALASNTLLRHTYRLPSYKHETQG